MEEIMVLSCRSEQVTKFILEEKKTTKRLVKEVEKLKECLNVDFSSKTSRKTEENMD